MTAPTQTIVKRITPTCSICGRKMRVVVYPDRTYRGGHYFGKIPLYRKLKLKKAQTSGTHQSKVGNLKMEVFNNETKPYSHAEYWECAKCYFQ